MIEHFQYRKIVYTRSHVIPLDLIEKGRTCTLTSAIYHLAPTDLVIICFMSRNTEFIVLISNCSLEGINN